MSIALSEEWSTPLLTGQLPSWRERAVVSLRVAVVLISVGLLAIGIFLSQANTGQGVEVGHLVQFVAALLMTLPRFVQVVRGLWRAEAESYTDQLVALAILGALLVGEYATAVLVPVIMDVGHLIEQHSIQGTHAAIQGLRRLSARSAVIVSGAGEKVVLPTEVQVGDILVVRAGDVLAADGTVSLGLSAIDESSITGEALPREVGVGDSVFAGSINMSGLIRVTATRTGEHTTLGQISGMLSAATQSKSPIVKMLERFAELYVPIVVLLAGFVLLYFRDLQRVISILVVSCPCALVLSGPAAMIAALACATRQGILLKNAKFLEALAGVDTVVFDKTGTLTQGHLEVAAVIPATGFDMHRVLEAALCCTAASKHPISVAITNHASRLSIQASATSAEIRELPGLGIVHTLDSRRVLLGKPSWLSENGLRLSTIPEHDSPLVGVAENDTFLGFVLLADQMRPEAPQVVRDLRSLGVTRIVVLTGDRLAAAKPVAAHLGADAVIADAVPQDKLHAVRCECADNRTVVVVGDGINDALALAAGNVGIAMGARGSDIAIHSADIALMGNDLNGLVTALRLSRYSRHIIVQNVILAALSAVAMFTAGAMGIISPLAGAVLHHIGTALVVLNSSRILRPIH